MKCFLTSLHTLLAFVVVALEGCPPSIHDVVGREDLEQAQAMLAENPDRVHARNAMGKTPLHYAVTYGAPELVDLLASKGADVNAADHTGLTPLHVAAMLNHSEEAGLLIEHGADIEARDAFGDTPFHFAALHGRLRMVRLLAQNGANTDTVNDNGVTPIEAARQNRKEDVVAFLQVLADSND